MKKQGRGAQLEERLGRVEEKLRMLSKRVEEETLARRTSTLRTSKKSTSVLR